MHGIDFDPIKKLHVIIQCPVDTDSNHIRQNKKYIYLGTCYGEDSLYKVRDFKGIEYFDGNEWIDDIEKLKSLCKIDAK